MDSIQIFKCGENTVAISNKNDYIIKTAEAFYYPNENVFHEVIEKERLCFVRTIKDNCIIAIVMVIIILTALSVYFLNASYVIADSSFLPSLFILFFNIILHESSHIIVLKSLFKESHFKCGFKLVFIYPAFYVDTSYSYFLPKYKRIAVYLAGNTANALFVVFSIILFPQFNRYLYLLVSNILVNFLPIVKSDGYYALVSLFNRFTIAKSKKSTFLEGVIRGMVMFAFLEIISLL